MILLLRGICWCLPCLHPLLITCDLLMPKGYHKKGCHCGELGLSP